jgi:Ca2+-binding RTX toxin-like protein
MMNGMRSAAAVLAAVLAGGLALALSGPASAGVWSPSDATTGGTRAGGMCRGEPAQIINVAMWSGTDERDVVVADAAVVDNIYTYGGDDLICIVNSGVRTDRVIVDSGDGDDTVQTVGGSNVIYSGRDDDIIYLNGSDENVWTESGNDDIWGLGVSNGLNADGGSGNDMVQGSLGNDWLYGGAGDDLIIGADGADMLHGGYGNDKVEGGAGTDTLDGDDDTDTCIDDAASTFVECESVVYSPPFILTS